MGGVVTRTTFQLILIKPTHYDDDGYPITWLRSHIPSNTLAALYGLGADCRQRQVLGADVDIVIKPFDETNTRVRADRIMRDLKRSGDKALICLVGVQSNQFPRATDLARQFIKGGFSIAMGGFHAAGCLSMLPVIPPEIQAAMDMGVSIYAGEAEEGRLDEVLLDAWNGTLKPLYNYHERPAGHRSGPDAASAPGSLGAQRGPQVELRPRPRLPRSSARSAPSSTCRAARAASCTPDDLEAIVRENYKQGITSFFITDDNMARNKHWEAFFDRLIELRENEGICVSLIIQVDTQCHRIPNFIHKARWAGVYRVFIGLENVNPDNLLAAKKRQNKITEYRKMLQAWHTSGASTWAGYILGFPGDTREIDPARHGDHQEGAAARHPRAVHALTPLPGSEDHQTLWKQGVDGSGPQQVRPPSPRRASPEDERCGVRADLPRRLAHLLHARAHRDGGQAPWLDSRPQPGRAGPVHDHVQDHVRGGGVHPLEGGVVRMKYRRDRRYGMPIESVGVFHWKLALETVRKLKIYGRLAWQGWRIGQKVKNDPKRHEYTDLALQPVMDDDMDKLSLFADTAGGGAAVNKRRGEDLARAKIAAQQNQRLAAAE